MDITFDQILKLLLYFIIYSFLGWVVESIFKTILSKKWVNSGFLYGPFCPIYGFGAIIMMITFNPIKQNFLLVFIMAFIILSIWEYIAGWLLEKKFDTKYWDYSDNFLNINGRVCLMNSIFWGILGVLFISIIHPYIQGYVNMLKQDSLIFFDIIFSIVMGADATITTMHIKSFDSTLQSIKELGENIKQKIIELKDTGKLLNESEVDKIKTNEKLIEELKQKQAILKFKLYKQMSRLKLAFPKMKSEKISNFLNQKIEFKELKEKIRKKFKNI